MKRETATTAGNGGLDVFALFPPIVGLCSWLLLTSSYPDSDHPGPTPAKEKLGREIRRPLIHPLCASLSMPACH